MCPVGVVIRTRCVPPGVEGLATPSRGLFGVVARFAQPLTVLECGRSAVGGGADVVDVPDGCIAPGRAADLVADLNQFGQ
ncbi:hypothetical protein GCM10023094_46920 [Rhodococcus olei]|uniref:Uncharacterized protein n=1 Tax=Rhodococcus olei TaxID=2161675 RepID=A0ABP8PK80_9NOCA